VTEPFNVFEPQEFVDHLRRGELVAQQALTLTGIVKEDEDNSMNLLFAFGTLCESWTSVPVDFIEKIELVEHLACGGHSNPLVNLTFKTPKSQENAVYSALLAACLKQRPRITSTSYHAFTSGGQQQQRMIPFVHFPGARKTELASFRNSCSECNEYEIIDGLGIGALHHCQHYPSGMVVCWYQYSG
jgi:hypothetical protein